MPLLVCVRPGGDLEQRQVGDSLFDGGADVVQVWMWRNEHYRLLDRAWRCRSTGVMLAVCLSDILWLMTSSPNKAQCLQGS